MKQSPGSGALACPYCGRTDERCEHRLAWWICDPEGSSEWEGVELPERPAQADDDGDEAIYVAAAIEEMLSEVAAALVRWHSLGTDGTLPLEGLSGAMCSLWSDTAGDMRGYLEDMIAPEVVAFSHSHAAAFVQVLAEAFGSYVVRLAEEVPDLRTTQALRPWAGSEWDPRPRPIREFRLWAADPHAGIAALVYLAAQDVRALDAHVRRQIAERRRRDLE